MIPLYLGVDGGATKTHAILLDRTGAIRGFGEGACGNHEVAGFDNALSSLRTAVEQAMGQADIARSDIKLACFCLAGADVAQDYEDIPTHMLGPLLGETPTLLKNDAFGCLRGGTRDPFGIMVNCGSGQVAVGRNRAGEELRVGGYGFHYGDFAGGNVIMQGAVAAAQRASDGRGEPTTLLQRLPERAGVADMQAFVERTYRDHDFLWNLALPKVVFAASADGDPIARRILLDCAREIITTAQVLIDKLGLAREEFDMILAGSVYRGSDPVFMDTIEAAIQATAPGVRPTFPRYVPAIGAALLALEAEGVVTDDELYENIEATMPAVLQG